MPGVWCQQGRLREDRSLTISAAGAKRIEDLAREEGFSRAGFAAPSGGQSILVCCLSCHRPEPDDLSTPTDPHGLIAPFARRNYYKTAVRMMRRVAARLEEELGIPRTSVRIFCNSRMPEKALCVAAGLAWLATNGLCIAPGLGSLFVIAGAVIPAALPGASTPATPLSNRCGSCRRCIDACPTGAIVGPGNVDRELCLQAFAGRDQALPRDVMEKWGTRLYGCQSCQSVCPHNRGPLEEGPPALGEIGPSVSLRWFLSLEGQRVRELFQGTAMGMSWISKGALVRNGLLAAGSSRNSGLRTCATPFLDSPSRALREAALWALERMA